MKIDIIVNDGSPMGVTYKTLYGEDSRQPGVGGAELALLTMCHAWQHAGHHVVLYNNPRERNVSPFEQKHVNEFNAKDPRDVLIIFRSPNPRAVGANGLKVWWSCDQFTVGSFKDFAPQVDKIVLISPFHKNYFKDVYGIEDTVVIDLPVRVDDYVMLHNDKPRFSKVKGRMIFNSIPDRGLIHLADSWDKIKEAVPDASLVITSDYRLWGVPHPNNDRYRQRFIRKDGVTFLGAVDRYRLCEEELKAEILPYPCTYDELFCISVAEAQAAGVYPVTSPQGAVVTTNMGTVIPGNVGDPGWRDRWLNKIIYLFENREELESLQENVKKKAVERFHPDKIMKEWENKVFK